MYSVTQMKAYINQTPVSESVGQLLFSIVEQWPQMVSDLVGGCPPDNNTVWVAGFVMDDSGSMGAIGKDDKRPNIAIVRECYNEMLQAIRTSTVSNSVMPGCLRLNAGVLYPFTSLLDDQKSLNLTPQNYNADGYTPLHDRIMLALAAIVIRRAALHEQGFNGDTASLVVLSDGIQEGSEPVFNGTQVSALMKAMIGSDFINLKAYAMGVTNPRIPDFRAVFVGLGFTDDDEHIFTAGTRDAHAIRRMFDAVTRGLIDTATRVLAGPYAGFGDVVSQHGVSGATLPPTRPDIHQSGKWWQDVDR